MDILNNNPIKYIAYKICNLEPYLTNQKLSLLQHIHKYLNHNFDTNNVDILYSRLQCQITIFSRDTKLDQLTLKQFCLTKPHKHWYSDAMTKVLSIKMLIKKENQTFP